MQPDLVALSERGEGGGEAANSFRSIFRSSPVSFSSSYLLQRQTAAATNYDDDDDSEDQYQHAAAPTPTYLFPVVEVAAVMRSRTMRSDVVYEPVDCSALLQWRVPLDVERSVFCCRLC